ncbi:MAG TPA: GTP-binding protein [Spirochaetota bacterium]|nr:GTP-binding protein [Spirochaetota bacterium]HOD13435.1 GTP-binding protein [Spirochaetota bacterium]HPG49384.1 GTP-binding protein [Spirochaetota bacterium]HPN10599.1 GTP-binding protein [Spirochaetota bacterium]
MTGSSFEQREKMNIVIVGHVDHGKSTVIGRLLVDTNSLPDGKLDLVRDNCERNSKPFEYAFLIDALKDEQSQGITIDSARVFFKTEKRDYIIIDAPGHIEFLKNMITGASHAEAALLVIDANEGVKENSRRHGYMLSMLGINQIAVLVNKMDLVDYSREVYDTIVTEYSAFLARINVKPACFVPISGRLGVNITRDNTTIPWYDGKTVLDALEEFQTANDIGYKPFRMPVQDVYKFTRFGDNRRIVAGTILSGSVTVGDELLFFPSGKKSRVKSIEVFNAPQPSTATAPCATAITLTEQIYITRGELAVKASEKKPCVTTRIKTSLFWLGKKPMTPNRNYNLKIGTDKMPVSIEKTLRVLNAATLEWTDVKESIDRHDVAECILQLSNPIAFDTAENNPMTSRFVIVDNYEISGGGIIHQELDDSSSWVRNSVYMRNFKWERSGISGDHRAERLGQNSAMIILTGKKDSGKKSTARALEKRLFNDGKIAYFLGIGNVLYGVDADIKGRSTRDEDNMEHIRRLGEIAHIMLDAGIILIVTAIELRQGDMDIIKTIVDQKKIETVWIGDKDGSDLACDLYIQEPGNIEENVSMIKDLLQEKSIIFKPSR